MISMDKPSIQSANTLEQMRGNSMESRTALYDKALILLSFILFCAIIVIMIKEFIGLLSGLWYGFGHVMMEFGDVIEQLPI